ncbi:MAG: hypothetical protein KDD38_11170, partial [Bdellovibrionales bacterium]|nr:hypothetical protein [Bdellovibrionales bacterium]
YNLDLTDTDLCPNFMLHETIHLFVNDFYGGHCPSYAEADSPNMLTARLLSGEACAGPLEFFVANEIPGVEFASIGRYNNYWRSDLHAHSLFLRLSQHCSKEYVFKFLFYSYLFINYYFEDISLAKKIRPKILDHLTPPENAKSVELLYKLSDKLFILNPTFIKRACRDYIHFIGGPSSLSEAYAFDLEKLAFDEDYFAPLLEHVAAFIFKNPKMRRPDSKLRSQSHRRHRQTDRGLGRVIR